MINKVLQRNPHRATANRITKVITEAPTGYVKNHSWLLVGEANAARTLSGIFQDRVRKRAIGAAESVRLRSAEQAE
jgi:hypothetical protein